MSSLSPYLLCTLLLLEGVTPVLAQQQLHLLGQVAMPEDEIVVGVDRDRIVLRCYEEWKGGFGQGPETRVARILDAPWEVEVPEVWGHVPQRHVAWSDVGEIQHLDIDPDQDMAVITGKTADGSGVWLSARPQGATDAWRKPWRIPALDEFTGQCAFAVFDGHPGREGDLLVALRPAMQRGAETLTPDAGHWKGGFDLARIPRLGGYESVYLLDAINSAADELSLVTGTNGGGWLSTERLHGAGGVDPWWCPEIPLGIDSLDAQAPAFLIGHTLELTCGDQTMTGLSWKVQSGGRGVAKLQTGTDGRVPLDILRADQRYAFSLGSAPPSSCSEATAIWRDSRGKTIRRWSIDGVTWELDFLTTMPLDDWRQGSEDLSSLPRTLDSIGVLPLLQADWVVFHHVGSMTLSPVDQTQIRALAQQLKSRPRDIVHVYGHASSDGNADDNNRLAAERARYVAAQLEFAGLPASQIRFEGLGDQRPMDVCPPGVSCPEGKLERSRRTELHISIARSSSGASLQ